MSVLSELVPLFLRKKGTDNILVTGVNGNFDTAAIESLLRKVAAEQIGTQVLFPLGFSKGLEDPKRLEFSDFELSFIYGALTATANF